jgi:hypothetical protein
MPDPAFSDPDLVSRYAQVCQRIERAARLVQRSADDITIVAVTKTHPIEAIRKARAIGITNFGENRVQETLEKLGDTGFLQADSQSCLHLIGHLQRNKVRKAVQIFDSIDSIDSIELAEAVDSEAKRAGKVLRVLLEVNTSKELQKQGMDPTQALSVAQSVASLTHLQLAGLMTVGPLTNDVDHIRNSFKILKDTFDDVGARLKMPGWSALSMGMSGDYEIAIEEGATEIRLGTALFGQRSNVT